MYKLSMKIIPALCGVSFAGLICAAPVDLNTADVDTIIAGTTGIGPGKAQAIVDYRRNNGPFATVDDVSKVLGIGKKLLEANRANFMVSTPNPKPGEPAKPASSPSATPANK